MVKNHQHMGFLWGRSYHGDGKILDGLGPLGGKVGEVVPEMGPLVLFFLASLDGDSHPSVKVY